MTSYLLLNSAAQREGFSFLSISYFPAWGMEGHKELIREERTESRQLTLTSQRDISNHVPLCGKKGRKKREFAIV